MDRTKRHMAAAKKVAAFFGGVVAAGGLGLLPAAPARAQSYPAPRLRLPDPPARPGAIPMFWPKLPPPAWANTPPANGTNPNGSRPGGTVVCPPTLPPAFVYPQYPQPIYVYPNGYPAQQQQTVIVAAPATASSVDLGNGTRVTFFGGYRATFITGQTVVSPFGLLYGCQPYIASSVVLNQPYRYGAGANAAPLDVWADGDPYIAANPDRGRALRAALNDLTRFWENGDVRGLRRRLDPDVTVAVFQNERFLYSLRPADLFALTADTLDNTDTLAFRFTDVQERNDGLVSATALHRYRVRGGGETRTARVRCNFVYLEGNWFLSSLSLAPGTLR